MTRMQRYIYGQTLFALAVIVGGLVLLALLAQALSRTDLIVENGQSALIFLKVVALGAPQVVSLVLPMALFVAAIWSLNRIHRDGEIVVVQAVGMTSWAVASPVFRLAAMAALAHLAINLWVQPAAQTEMRATLAAAKADLVSSLIREGRFNQTGDLTFFARERDARDLRDVYISDLSDPQDPIDYIASTAQVTTVNGAPTLILVDGHVLQNDEFGELSVLDFDRYAFDLGAFAAEQGEVFLKASDRTLDRLLFSDEKSFFDVQNRERFLAEAHNRLSGPLLNFVMAMLAVIAIFGGDFNRQGYGRRIMYGAVAALGVLI
ncbi:MAG: LptF/LptG family permease, partial [Pseudomonadota bacterium]